VETKYKEEGDGVLHENNQIDIMRSSMVQIVQTCQDYKSNTTNDSSYNCTNGQSLLEQRCIMMQRATVSEPALGDKDCVEGDDCYCSGCDEERLECVCADI
jgi:hypothetical protein